MKLYNTKTTQKEEFVPLHAGKVNMYACGPTVYNYIHVGNARPIVMFDALRRYFEFSGYDVTFVQNFTDIDDKIINAANKAGVPYTELTEKFIAEYFTDARGLGVRAATVHPRATENIAEIIALIQTLIGKELAYERNGDVYFRTENFSGYGKLSHQPRDALLAGARVEVDEVKESAVDFALWKSAKPNEPYWDSPWGRGRPGWHIECSAMSLRYLGETLDIHCGGQDLVFPHHENETAQSEGATGREFARYWLHNGFISIDNKKMSKSQGNFFTVRDAAEVYGYETLRMFLLMSHYRSPLNYSVDVLTQAKTALERLKTARSNFVFLTENGEDGALKPAEAEFTANLPRFRERFVAAMDDDFNTADAISILFELVREGNSALAAKDENAPTKALAAAILAAFDELENVVGLIYGEPEAATDDLAAEVEALIEARAAARAAKDWSKADEIRDRLKAMNITLEDTPQGVKWKRG
ncbi:MAG: cysteine--tRNA ligase [Oscillospiraceae bacterium]|jgi:cysteinyl-tRNA synthetase|nr:cysteine--tRNA ligase [Oscillospiraceae bacterium]